MQYGRDGATAECKRQAVSCWLPCDEVMRHGSIGKGGAGEGACTSTRRTEEDGMRRGAVALSSRVDGVRLFALFRLRTLALALCLNFRLRAHRRRSRSSGTPSPIQTCGKSWELIKVVAGSTVSGSISMLTCRGACKTRVKIPICVALTCDM